MYTPAILTFAKNTSADYELTEYAEPENGEKWDWAENNRINVNNLGLLTRGDAMVYYFGTAPSNGTFQTGGMNVYLTNVAETQNEVACSLIKYIPGATLRVLGYDKSIAYRPPGSWVIEYADPSKNITIGISGTGVIPITDDLIGLYCADANTYSIKFEKYVVRGQFYNGG